jgi:hypothetical protein
MPNTVKFTRDCREDWLPIIEATFNTLTQVLQAGEEQRLAKGLDPNAWFTSDPIVRLNHVLLHTLQCHHAQSLDILTKDTVLEEWKHALCGLGIVAALEAKKQQPVGLIIETLDEE